MHRRTSVLRKRFKPIKIENIEQLLCDYGCERMANYKFKNGKLCCSNHRNGCLEIKKRYIGDKNPMKIKENSIKCSKSNIGKHFIPKSEESKIKQSNSMKGKLSKEFIEWLRQEMLNGKAVKMIKAIKKISKPEIKLRNLVKELYPKCRFQHQVFNYALDIALPNKKIAIEYDGYYHFNCKESIVYHNHRQKRIEEKGWKFLRYNKIPSKEKLISDLKGVI